MNPLKPLLKPYKKLLQQKRKKLSHYDIDITSDESRDGVCECIGSDGGIKDWYESIDIAQQVAKRYESEFKIRLDIYHCPTSKGWHLTKV